MRMKTQWYRVVLVAAFAVTLLVAANSALAAPPQQEGATPTVDPFLGAPTPTVDPLLPAPTTDPLLQEQQNPPPDSPLPTPFPAPGAEPTLEGSAPVTSAVPLTDGVPLQPEQPAAPEQPVAPVAPVVPVEPTPPPPPLTAEQLLNATILVPAISPTATVQLQGGTYQIPGLGATVTLSPTLVAIGDLNGDGAEDAAAILQTLFADGATRTNLVAFVNSGGQPIAAAATELAGPLRVDALRVEKGAIWLDLRVQGPTDSPTSPTLALKRIYVLRGDTLLDLPAASYGKLFPYRYGRLAGYVNVLGEFVVPPRYSVADEFVEGLALVSEDGTRFGFINRLGQVAIPPAYLSATRFNDGVAVAVPALIGAAPNTSGAVVYIDRTGRNIFGAATFGAGQPFAEGLAAVQEANGLFGFIDRTGAYAIAPAFDYVLSFSEGLAAVLVGDKVGYINRIGEMVIEPQFDAADLFAEGVAAVGLDTQVGFIDHTGAFAIAPDYTRAEGFVEGLAVALLDGQEVFVDHSGTPVISAPAFTDAHSFSEGLAAVKVGDRFGYLNTRGEMAIEPQFVVATPFSDGLAVVETADAWGVINADGVWMVQLTLLQPSTAQAGALTTVITDTTATVATTETLVLTAAVTAPGTALVPFAPPVPSEIRQGACYAGSDLLRSTSAWRCGVTGGEIFDPCVLANDGATVVCGANPATGEPGFVLELTDALPAVALDEKVYPGAWLFQLGNGAICSFNQGASITVEGQRINYTCDDLTQLLGEIDKSGPVWTINIVTTSDDGQGVYAIETLTPMTIVRAWAAP